MFRKLLLLSFITTAIPSYTIDSVIEKIEKKVDVILDNLFDLADILFTSPEIDKINLEKEFILLLDKQVKKIEENKETMYKKIGKQGFINRLDKFISLAKKLGLLVLKKS